MSRTKSNNEIIIDIAKRIHHHGLSIPVATKLVKKILSIPNHDKMTDEQVEYVADKIYDYYKR